MNDYSYKKSDEPQHRRWKAAIFSRKAKRNTSLIICFIVALAFWHIFRTHASFAQSERDDIEAKFTVRSKERLNHKRFHDRFKIELETLTEDSKTSNNDHEGIEEVDAPSVAWRHRHQADEVASTDETQQVENLHMVADTSTEAEKRSTTDEKSEVDEAAAHLWEKGPVEVEANLDYNEAQEPLLSSPEAADRQRVIEAEPEQHLVLEETAESLPEIIHIPFEQVVKGQRLEGWEDEWLSKATFDKARWSLKEPKIDFVYLWVNGSEEAFQETKRPYEENSILNDPEGHWISSHGVNRYRDWDELRYAVRSVEKHARSFRNQIQIIVNSVQGTEAGKQIPSWLNEKASTAKIVKVIAQEEFMDKKAQACLPTFNSLTIENQLFNTPSDTDYMFALSDDMLLGSQHAASDIVSPLLGPVMGFKTNQYNTIKPPTEEDAQRFGEKPFLIYTSWLLNRRFGQRKRKGQGHFGHALSREVMKEAISSFPGPELESACKRFRREPGFQLYSWFVTFHYLIERYREAMLWSLIVLRSDTNGDGYLSWDERKSLMQELTEGMANEGKVSFRKRIFYHVRQHLERAGLEAPKVNTDFTWTSLDGPASFVNLQCDQFDINECLGPGFSVSMNDYEGSIPAFTSAVVFERVARQRPDCGDCLLKLVLNQVRQGLEPILPSKSTKPDQRELAVKALMRYKYTIVEPNGLFTMLTDAEQIDNALVEKFIRRKVKLPGQLCLNDDVDTTDDAELADIQNVMTEFYQGLFPEKSQFEV